METGTLNAPEIRAFVRRSRPGQTPARERDDVVGVARILANDRLETRSKLAFLSGIYGLDKEGAEREYRRMTSPAPEETRAERMDRVIREHEPTPADRRALALRLFSAVKFW